MSELFEQSISRKDFLEELKTLFLKWKKKWIFVFFSTQLVPLLEIAFISCIYFFISPQGSGEKLFFEDIFSYFALPKDKLDLIMFLIGLILLVSFIGLKYLSEKVQIGMMYAVYKWDSLRLIERYLFTRIDKAKEIGKEKITSSIINDCASLAVFLKNILIGLAAFISVLYYLGGALFLSWKMLIVAGVIYAIPLWVNRKMYRRMENIGQLKVKTQELLLGFFTDILNGFERMKMDGIEQALKESSHHVIDQSQAWRIQKRTTQMRLTISMDGISLLGLLLVIYIGIVIFKVDISTLMILFVIFNRMRTYVALISKALVQIRSILPHSYRLIALLNWFKEYSSLEKQKGEVDHDFHKVELQKLTYSYEEKKIFEDLDLTLNKGDRVLLEGPSGCGKSTFLEILGGVLPPEKGKVLIDGTDFDEELFYQLRHQIVYVSPLLYLFKGSLRENLSMGKEIEEDVLRDALQKSHLESLITELPKGIDSDTGVNGNKLSLGQKQRLLLARIFLRQPKLFLLDEITANLDPKLEGEIIETIYQVIPSDAILIMVAHKKPANATFNRYLYMSEGKILEKETSHG